MESSVKLNEPKAMAADDEIDLLKLWHTIWRRKWAILALVVVVMAATTLAVLSITPIYRAGATLLIEQKQAKVVSIEQMYGLEGTGNEYLQTQFELLKSRALAERVVRQLELTTHREFDPRQQPAPLLDIGGMIAGVKALLPLERPARELTEEEKEAQLFDLVVRNFMGRINVTPLGKSQLVRVEIEMADAAMATRAANALATGFIEGQMEAIMEMSLTATNWMNSRLQEIRDKLKEAEDRLQQFREDQNLVDIDGVATISASELSATSDRMIDARRQRAEAESMYRQVQSMKSAGWQRLASVPAVLGDPLIQQFKANEAKAQAKVDELGNRYGERHPTMQAAKTELAAAQASLRAQVEQVVAGIERNYQLAMANEGSLKASVESNKAQIQDISRKEFKLRELQREVETNRALYDTFLTRLKETAATSDLESANARIVDQAVLPKVPVKPKKGLIIAIAGILAALIGTGLALLVEMLSNTFKESSQVENLLNLPVLGILPLVKKQDRAAVAHLFAANKDKSFSESIRTIRTGVMLSNMDEQHRVLVVTSSIPGEGKSTVSANLAYALGQMERVLLIDADMRRPTLAKNFGFAPGTPGLANLISGTAKFEECIRSVDGIDMLTAGAVPPNPLELLSSPRFVKIMEMLRSRYDRIVIDSPPTQAVSDALVLGTKANGLIYVVRWESTAIPLVQKGVGQLLQASVPVTGVVLNQVDIDKARKHGYTYGGYYDYYGYSDSSKA